MQVSNCMQTAASIKSARLDARQRLLAAATRIFARDGLEGATTREIAREAEVNEVTLFRHFHTKAKLQEAVMEWVLDQQAELLAAQPASCPCDLRAGLLRHIHIYEALLDQNILLIRTLISEIHRHEEHERRVLTGIFAPLRAELIATLEVARDTGIVRADVEPAIAADLLNAMIFTSAMRRDSPYPPWEYSRADYVKSCVDFFVRGIEQKR